MKISSFSCREAISSQISAKRANLPLSSGENCPSPSKWLGWLQSCFNRIKYASTRPRRLIPSNPLQQIGQLLDQLGVENRLTFTQPAIGTDFGLVGQIVDDPPVGLQTPQNIRLHQVPQRGIPVLLPRFQHLDELLKLGLRAQEAG